MEKRARCPSSALSEAETPVGKSSSCEITAEPRETSLRGLSRHIASPPGFTFPGILSALQGSEVPRFQGGSEDGVPLLVLTNDIARISPRQLVNGDV
ncbi:hypothetical protein K0M31_007776 [Melipona bicolor]|uniref:Uncharacterized protein n=1 Tax=Melipona bicolor TaxID=60889 RepID=A0AA40GCV1_9HYME|nr:hypothetical protein K0M31_007776 [Melipona bicolor]